MNRWLLAGIVSVMAGAVGSVAIGAQAPAPTQAGAPQVGAPAPGRGQAGPPPVVVIGPPAPVPLLVGAESKPQRPWAELDCSTPKLLMITPAPALKLWEPRAFVIEPATCLVLL